MQGLTSTSSSPVPTIEAHDLELAFRGMDRPVLDGVTLSVHPGESVAVLGPSGSGKTSLLAVLGGLIRPDRGQVKLRAGSATLPVAWITQTTNVLPARTAIENVALGAYAAGAPRDQAQARAVEALQAVSLGNRATARVASLSGGERQRVCIARAVASKAPMVLADEPTGQLDSVSSQGVINLLAATTRAGASLITATHDQDVARSCHRVVELRDGRLRDVSEVMAR